MENVESDTNVQAPSGALNRARLTTGAAMAIERLWPKVLPLFFVVISFVTLSWFGAFRGLSDQPRYALGATFALIALAALMPLLRLRLPSGGEITARIEAANRLEHQPIAVQSDRPAGGDAVAGALWLEHQRRMAAKLGTVAGDMPRPAIPRRDPFALRVLPVFLATVALAFSFGPSGGRLTDILHGAPPPERIPPRIDAWVTPPPYTGRAPIFLTAAANVLAKDFSVPAGSLVTLRVIGGAGSETAKLGSKQLVPVAAAKNAAVSPSAQPTVFTTALSADSSLSLSDGEKALGQWQFKIIPDLPPKIEFSKEPERALNGTLTLSYTAKDDYGIASAKAVIQSDGADPKAHPLFTAPDLKLSAPGRRSKDGAAKTSKDLSEHPWAGTSVRVTLSAMDDAAQEGLSGAKKFDLPERVFTSPLAKALIEHRRLIAMDARQKPRVLDLMYAISMRPEDTIKNPAHFLGLHTARVRLAAAANDAALREVVAYLWEVANGIENSGLSDARRRLKQAQEKMSQALEKGASEEELQALMKELREAMNEVMKELAEQAQKDQNFAQVPPGTEMLSQSDIDKMLQKLEDLAKQGAKEQAQELLSQLNEMMNNLQMGQGQQQGGENGNAMGEQLNKLGEMMRRQQELMDETQRAEQGQSGGDGEMQGGEGNDGQRGEGTQPGEGGNQFGSLQGRQGQLKRDLQDMMKALEGLGLDPGKDFGDAGKSMGQAEGNLGDGEGSEALADQSEALESLRKGGQGLMEQMQQALGDQGGGTRLGQRRGPNSKDPLGRPRATTGPDFGQTTKVPDDIDVQRAREILEAIRKRLGDAISPDFEKSYLERLLKFE